MSYRLSLLKRFICEEVDVYFKKVGIFHLNILTRKGVWWGEALENTNEDNV